MKLCPSCDATTHTGHSQISKGHFCIQKSFHGTVWWIWAIIFGTHLLTLVPSIYVQLFYPFSSLQLLRTKFVCISHALSFAWFDNCCCRVQTVLVQTVLVSSFGFMFISVSLKHSSTLLYKATRRITPWHIIKSSAFKVGSLESNYRVTQKKWTFEKPPQNWRNPRKKNYWQKLNHYNLPFKRQ